MSWLTNLWQILEAVATFTRNVERVTSDIKELRKDLNTLTLTAADLKSDLGNQKETTKLVLDNYESEIDHAKESIAAKFDVLTTRLDAKVADFERRLSNAPSRAKGRALKGKANE